MAAGLLAGPIDIPGAQRQVATTVFSDTGAPSSGASRPPPNLEEHTINVLQEPGFDVPFIINT